MGVVLDEAAIRSVYSALLTYAQQTGCLSRSPLGHEPLNGPGSGLSFSLAEGPMLTGPSGLAATSLTWQMTGTFWYPWQEGRSQDFTDVKLTAAVVQFLGLLATDITLAGAGVAQDLIRQVNVLAPVSEPLWTEDGGARYRIRRVQVDVLVNDAYSQAVT